jgi:hypothetical protein
MKNKALYIISVFVIAALAACGPTPAPTMNPADAQGTAVAAAWTVVAMTQVAIPTATAMPPTETPIPTPLPTLAPPPTSDIPSTLNIPPTSYIPPTQPVFVGVPTNPPAPGAPADPCNLPISSSAEGRKVKTRIVNQTDGSVVLSLYLSKNLFGQCGYYSFNIDPRGSVSADLLEGNYWAGAFVTGKKDTKAFGVSLTIKAPTGNIRITDNEIK